MPNNKKYTTARATAALARNMLGRGPDHQVEENEVLLVRYAWLDKETNQRVYYWKKRNDLESDHAGIGLANVHLKDFGCD